MKWEKLKPIVVLTAICVIVSAALVGTYGLTKPVIDAAKAAEAMRPFPPFCPMAPTSRKSPSPPKMSSMPTRPAMALAMYSRPRARASRA